MIRVQNLKSVLEKKTYKVAEFSVMIIDDESVDRRLLKRFFKKENIQCEIFEVDNGKEGLDFLTSFAESQKKFPETFPPNIVFLDINMPVMDGFRFLEEYEKKRKQDPRLKSVVYLTSTSTADKDMTRLKKFSFVEGYVNKSTYSAETIKELVKPYL